MAYFCVRQEDNDFVITTTIQGVSEFSGIAYHRVYEALKNGSGISEIDGFLMGGKPIKKGRQRVKMPTKSDVSLRINKDGKVVEHTTMPRTEMDEFDKLFQNVKNDQD